MHAIADMVGHLRARPGARGLVWANGWYATKHAVGVYGQAAPPKPYRRRAPATDQAVIDAGGARPVATGYTGVVHVVASTVLHDSDGAPATGIAIVENAAGERMCANLREDQLADACTASLVGRRAHLTRNADAAQVAIE